MYIQLNWLCLVVSLLRFFSHFISGVSCIAHVSGIIISTQLSQWQTEVEVVFRCHLPMSRRKSE